MRTASALCIVQPTTTSSIRFGLVLDLYKLHLVVEESPMIVDESQSKVHFVQTDIHQFYCFLTGLLVLNHSR